MYSTISMVRSVKMGLMGVRLSSLFGWKACNAVLRRLIKMDLCVLLLGKKENTNKMHKSNVDGQQFLSKEIG